MRKNNLAARAASIYVHFRVCITSQNNYVKNNRIWIFHGNAHVLMPNIYDNAKLYFELAFHKHQRNFWPLKLHELNNYFLKCHFVYIKTLSIHQFERLNRTKFKSI